MLTTESPEKAEVNPSRKWLDAEQHSAYGEIADVLFDLLGSGLLGTVVDVGCGAGTGLSALRARHPGITAGWGVDPDADMRQLCQAEVSGWCGVVPGTLDDFGALFPPEFADLVTMMNCVHLAAEFSAVAAASARTLRTGGQVAIASGYFEGAVDPGDRIFYAAVLRSAQRYLKKELGLGRDRFAGTAKRLDFTESDLVDAFAGQGFTVSARRVHRIRFDTDLAVATVATPMFASGVFPHVPAADAIIALEHAVRDVMAKHEERPHRGYLLLVLTKSGN